MKSKIDSIIDNLFEEIEQVEKTASTKEAKKTALGNSLIKIAQVLRVKTLDEPVSYDALEEALRKWDN